MQHVRKRVGRVRVIDDRVDPERADAFHPARYGPHGGETAHDRLIVDAGRAREADRGERVGNVEPAGQVDLDVHAAGVEMRSVALQDDVRRAQLRHAIDRVRGRRRKLTGERAADRIVDVEHRERRQVEEVPLGGDIAPKRAVKIEMVARDVGQYRRAKVHVVGAPQRQCVRGHLHRNRARAGVAHFRERAMQFDR